MYAATVERGLFSRLFAGRRLRVQRGLVGQPARQRCLSGPVRVSDEGLTVTSWATWRRVMATCPELSSGWPHPSHIKRTHGNQPQSWRTARPLILSLRSYQLVLLAADRVELILIMGAEFPCRAAYPCPADAEFRTRRHRCPAACRTRAAA